MQNIVLVTALVLVFTGTNVILQTLPWILTVFEVVSHKTYLGNVRQRCSIGRAWQILLKGHAPPSHSWNGLHDLTHLLATRTINP